MQNRQMRLTNSSLDNFPVTTFILADTDNQAFSFNAEMTAFTELRLI